MSDWKNYQTTEQNVTDSRRAYFGNLSYIDEKIGDILETLKACEFDDDTIVLFVSDHGDMLGEKGLWFKMSFYEGSARVPLLVHAPDRFGQHTVTEPTSTLDVLPTLVDLAGGDVPDDVDGISLLGAIKGEFESRPVFCEYAAEGSIAPMVMVRQGRYKLNVCLADPDQLFDLEEDPCETKNLAGDPDFQEIHAEMRVIVDSTYDLEAYEQHVMESQQQRLMVYDALRNGEYQPWDHQPQQSASQRYMRNHKDLNRLEGDTRFPRHDRKNK
jgi:choline-sulfatase